MVAWYWIPITVVACVIAAAYALAWFLGKAFKR